ncbi:hypothetical protein ABFS82_12G009500 [Erythranthe guttata]|uniref:CID domain-containing protein n=1 Tax=Erythranthe guttata TaxID=4155 RepID=A0A022Q7W0_ERYGU|nr:PREDICTED: regulation of nuclear pre-mRNA domain-containing protein 1A-like [Erythranthe guttata]EYU24021.1 hypothetical protein MIMGU_mgv1a005158mg [Erythranthe guttata]|eukprot:XP_012853541.1 PREDICTED: regulation of nuclear pre-mRNA domain-containing protein 1A-like [Erythranthe guttata]
MNSVCTEQILAEKLSKLNSTQQCIETLSHWCIFHRSKAELVVSTWEKQFQSSEMAKKVPLLHLANDILQNSRRKGDEFVTEFWKVLPSALKEVVNKGDEREKKAALRLVGIWEERRVFGSHAQSLKETILGEELPPPLELKKKRSRSVKIVRKDSRSIRTKLSIGGTAEKIVSAFHSVLSENANEDEQMSKCKSSVHRVKKMEKDVDVALTKAKDPSRKTLSKDLEEEENLLKECIEKLKAVETDRVALVSQLRDALLEQESELENLRTQIQVAQAQVEEAELMRKHLNEDRTFEPKKSNPPTEKVNGKSAQQIAAEVADRLAASTSSQYIMTSVLSTFAAEEAKNASLTTSSSGNNPPQQQHNPYNMVQPPPQISNSQAHYIHSIPNPPYNMGSYDYNGGLALQTGPPAPAPPYMVSPMVPLMQQQAPQMPHQQQQPPPQMPHQQPLPPQMTHQQQMVTMGHQQQPQGPASFRAVGPMQAAPGMVYYTHPYGSQ